MNEVIEPLLFLRVSKKDNINKLIESHEFMTWGEFVDFVKRKWIGVEDNIYFFGDHEEYLDFLYSKFKKYVMEEDETDNVKYLRSIKKLLKDMQYFVTDVQKGARIILQPYSGSPYIAFPSKHIYMLFRHINKTKEMIELDDYYIITECTEEDCYYRHRKLHTTNYKPGALTAVKYPTNTRLKAK